MTDQGWVVLKFGGTSVSTRRRWEQIGARALECLEEGLRPLVVVSALRGVSDRLDAMVDEAVAGGGHEAMDEVDRTHRELADRLGVSDSTGLSPFLDELARLTSGIRLIGEASPEVRARVVGMGELLCSTLGASFLGSQGIETTWLDARDLLTAREEPPERARSGILSATCDADPDPALAARLGEEPGVLLTQGFIARGPRGGTVLLGRGGSDTSAAYLAGRLSARRLEIWTDVPGMFSADPRAIPSARLLQSLDYFEAQEIASMGSRVLHPRCIPPVRRRGIPLHVRCTDRPEWPGTVISASPGTDAPQLKAISTRDDVTLVSMETMGMWQEVGFLARAFERFAANGLSIDLVSTSESNVTVSIDGKASRVLDPRVLDRLVEELERFSRVRVIDGCASVSLIGRGIRTILHDLGPALEVFEHHNIHLMTQAANDLNLSFVVDAEQAPRLVQRLHDRVLERFGRGPVFGPRWDELTGPVTRVSDPGPWWIRRRAELLAFAEEQDPAYVYDLDTVGERLAGLLDLAPVDRVLYAMKANGHEAILRRVEQSGCGIECVSIDEVRHTLAVLPDLDPTRILFTPNFAHRAEYQEGFEAGVHVTLDNLHPLRHWPEIFRGREIFVRLDPGQGHGHHEHVRTAGDRSKFGIRAEEVDELLERCRGLGTQVVGLHAHAGSGVLDPGSWARVGAFLGEMARALPELRTLDLGGGLGVPERPGERPLDLTALETALAGVRAAFPQYELWLEPGRYLVAEAGVLLARVTQLKQKGDAVYIGVSTGMNSLIRPALYGSYHEIVNLTRLEEVPTRRATIVGPICETGDRLGTDRWLPETEEGDVILVADAGAYGAVMSSGYNRRSPAREFAW